MTDTHPELTARTHDALSVPSETASPRSIASLPSPPSSPKLQAHDDSSIPSTPSSFESDLPISSLGSSLFLSGSSSPGLHPSFQQDVSSRTLIIPSLTIPQYDPARGDAVGNIKLWVIGVSLPDCQVAAENIVKDAPLVSEIGDWIFTGNGVARLHASTVSSAYQLLPQSLHHTKWNVEVYVADVSVDSVAQPASMVDSILAAIQEPFKFTDRLLNDSEPSTTSFIPLLTSSTTLLHTAVVYVRSSPATRHDQVIINELSPYIPVITMPVSSFHASDAGPSKVSEPAATSTIRPKSLVQLRDNLFLNPSTLHHLRTEAAERFLRWRDLNAALRAPESPTVHPLDVTSSREPFNSNASQPQLRGMVRNAGSARSSSTMFNLQMMPQLVPTRAPLPAPVPPQLPGVEEHPRDWIWNWESRFSRDVFEQQQRHPLPAFSTSPAVSGASAPPVRIPLSVATSSRAIVGLSCPTGTIGDGCRIQSPPIPHAPSPAHSADGHDEDKSGDRIADDPLHLRSVARIAASIVPALFRRYRFFRSRTSTQDHAVHRQERRQEREKHQGGMSLGTFGFGVSVGVVLSIFIVGVGMELSYCIWST